MDLPSTGNLDFSEYAQKMDGLGSNWAINSEMR